MKGKILLVAGLLFASFILLAPVSHAEIEWSKTEPVQKVTIDGVEYGWKKLPLENKCAIVHIKVKKTKKTIKIPSSITGYEVAYLGCHDKKNNLWGEDYTNYPEMGNMVEARANTIVIPDSVEKMGEGTFSMVRGLKKVVLSDSLESLPKDVFSNCVNLRHVVLGEDTRHIGANAFWETPELEKIDVQKGNLYFTVMSGYLLGNGESEIVLAIPNVKEGEIPNTVSKIKPLAFWNTSRSKIQIPETVTNIYPQGLSTKKTVEVSVSDKNSVYGTDQNSIYKKETGCLVGNVVKDGVMDVHSWKVTVVDGLISTIGGKPSVIRYPITLVRLKKHWTQCASVVEFRTLIPPSIVEENDDCFASIYVYPEVASIQYEDVLEKADALVNPKNDQVAKKQLKKYNVWELVDQITDYYESCFDSSKK